jgi:hypothetical protein
MTANKVNTGDLWASWRRLYPIYCTLARELVIDFSPCYELEEDPQVPTAEAVAEAAQWFSTMDERIRIHHLRQFAQTSTLMSEQVLTDLLVHTLNKTRRGEEDRDKADFVIVQIFSFRVPSRLAISNFSIAEAAAILEPVLGPCSTQAPPFAKELDEMIADAGGAKNLNALFTSRIIERSRIVKTSCGSQFFEPISMVAFARFGFLIRRSFFRLMQQDLNAILDGLRELEAHGVSMLDCRKAQFGAEESITRIRMICQSWRVMFQAEYSSGQPLCLLVDLKTAVETALAQYAKSSAAAPGKPVASSARVGK